MFGVDIKAGLTSLASDNDAAEAAAAHSGKRDRYRIDFIVLVFFMRVIKKEDQPYNCGKTLETNSGMTKSFEKLLFSCRSRYGR